MAFLKFNFICFHSTIYTMFISSLARDAFLTFFSSLYADYYMSLSTCSHCRNEKIFNATKMNCWLCCRGFIWIEMSWLDVSWQKMSQNCENNFILDLQLSFHFIATCFISRSQRRQRLTWMFKELLKVITFHKDKKPSVN